MNIYMNIVYTMKLSAAGLSLNEYAYTVHMYIQ